jgi:hypothetical protein
MSKTSAEERGSAPLAFEYEDVINEHEFSGHEAM